MVRSSSSLLSHYSSLSFHPFFELVSRETRRGKEGGGRVSGFKQITGTRRLIHSGGKETGKSNDFDSIDRGYALLFKLDPHTDNESDRMGRSKKGLTLTWTKPQTPQNLGPNQPSQESSPLPCNVTVRVRNIIQ